MAEKFVTVASFSVPLEAQLARGRLEGEGIPVFLTGDLTADTLAGMGGVGGQVQLQVAEADQERAARVLAQCAGEELDEDWQTRAEEDAGVWVCSLCGDPVGTGLDVCPSCGTAREAIQTGLSHVAPYPRRRANPPPRQEGVQRRDQLAPGAPDPPAHEEVAEDELELPPVETFLGDDLARRAFRAALFGCVFTPLTLYSAWLLIRLGLFSGKLSGGGMQYFYWALGLDALVGVFWLFWFLYFLAVFFPW